MRLTAVSRAAAAIGMAPGLTLADARAREPALIVIDRDHAFEAQLLARIVAGCARYTPMAASEPPDGAILDITGCTQAFAGEAGIVADLAARLAAGGGGARIALGDTPEAARARARFGQGTEPDLVALPIAALEASPESETALRRAGLRTIGDLACRPRRMLAARFGDVALRLGRMLGEQDRRITPERPPAPVMALRRFAEPIGRVEDALACLAELLAQAGEELARRHQGGRRFVARFFRSDGLIAPLMIETGQPTRDPALLMRLFHERLEALADPIDPGFGFDLIRLDVLATEPLAAIQADHLQAAQAREDMAELVDRLVTRLGPGRVRRVRPRNTHIPECRVENIAAAGKPDWPPPPADEPPLRPLRLLDPPRAIDVIYVLPEGPPRCFAWNGRTHDIARWEGPERIAAEWWRRRDRGGRTRDYYRVEDMGGRRFWLFRHGLHERGEGDPAWYLHGLFA